MSSTTQWTAVIISLLCFSFSPSRADPVQPPPQLHLKLNQKSKVAQEKGFVRVSRYLQYISIRPCLKHLFEILGGIVGDYSYLEDLINPVGLPQ